MPTILVCSREVAATLKSLSDVVFISLYTPRIDYSRIPVPSEGWKDFLSLCFNDTTEPQHLGNGQMTVQFSPVQAQTLFDFLHENKGTDIIVHCDAGISRSMAVGAWVRDYFDYELDLAFAGVPHDGFKNILVYNLLRRLAMGENNGD